jgi:hypothetical protein
MKETNERYQMVCRLLELKGNAVNLTGFEIVPLSTKAQQEIKYLEQQIFKMDQILLKDFQQFF